MFNLGGGEVVVVALVALIVLGPTRLPQAARQFGRAMSEFRRVTSGLQTEVRDAMAEFEREVSLEEEPPTFPTQIDPPAPAEPTTPTEPES